MFKDLLNSVSRPPSPQNHQHAWVHWVEELCFTCERVVECLNFLKDTEYFNILISSFCPRNSDLTFTFFLRLKLNFVQNKKKNTKYRYYDFCFEDSMNAHSRAIKSFSEVIRDIMINPDIREFLSERRRILFLCQH